MNATTIKKTVLSIIRQREFLIKNNRSNKNKSECLAITKRIKNYVDAYGNKYTIEGWKRFIKNNLDELFFLVPKNKSGESVKNKLILFIS